MGPLVRTVLMCLAMVTPLGTAFAQSPGAVDVTFDPGSAVNGEVYLVAAQPDGTTLVAGEFTVIGGAIRNRFARLLTDGTADLTFNPGGGVTAESGRVETHMTTSLISQPDGKSVISGSFRYYDGTRRNGVARINPNGTLDDTFDPAAGPDSGSVATVLQPDGKFLVTGSFATFAGVARNRIARLHPDGRLDLNFDPGRELNGVEGAIAQPDGNVLVWGALTTALGAGSQLVARLKPDGSPDATFTADARLTELLPTGVTSAITLPDGKSLIWGMFTAPYFNPAWKYYNNRLLRLNGDGSLDTSFNASTSAVGTWGAPLPLQQGLYGVHSVLIEPDGKLLIAGGFEKVNADNKPGIARLLPDGATDPVFKPITGPNGPVASAALLRDGQIVIVGNFTAVNQVNRGRLARLTPEGALDLTFNEERGISGRSSTINVGSLGLQPDGKVLIAGSFDRVGTGIREGVARLEADGSLDLLFTPPSAPDAAGRYLLVQPDGKVVLYRGAPGWSGRLIRLNPDGSLDTSFMPASEADVAVRALGLEPDGTLLVAGSIFQGTTTGPRLVRLKPDGSLDPSFNAGAGPDREIQSMILQPDGRWIVAGVFTSFNGVTRHGVARLMANGAVDPTFDPGVGADDEVVSVLLQPHGKIVIAGAFTRVHNAPRNKLARLNPDGSLDATFDPGLGVEGGIWCAALQADGRLLVGGFIDRVGQARQGYLARFNPEGTPDTSFDLGPGILGRNEFGTTGVNALAVLPDGRIVIAGSFETVNGTARGFVARLHGVAVASPFAVSGPRRSPDGGIELILLGQVGRRYVIQTSSDLTQWSELGTVVPDSEAFTVTDPGASSALRRFYRVRTE